MKRTQLVITLVPMVLLAIYLSLLLGTLLLITWIPMVLLAIFVVLRLTRGT